MDQATLAEQQQSTSVIDQFIQRAGQLYSLPGVAMEVLQLTQQPTVDSTKLKQTIENDPALTIKILRAVNSPIYGLSREVSDLAQALSMLGTKPLKMLVLGFSLPRDLFAGVEAEVLEWYWRHSLIRGLAARELSKHFDDVSEDDAFIAGLLQGIGILLLVKDLRAPYVEFLHEVVQDGVDLAQLEMATMGFDHRILSARLLESWDLPRHLAEAIGLPSSVDRIMEIPAGRRELPQVLILADLMAQFLIGGKPQALADVLSNAEQFGGLDIHAIEAIVVELEDKIPHLAEVLSLDIGQEKYTEVLWEAFVSLSKLVEEIVIADDFEGKGDSLKRAMDASSRSRSLQCESTTSSKPSQSEANLNVDSRAMGEPDPGLLGRLTAGVAECRRDREPISFVLIEADQFDDLVLSLGAEGASQQMMLFKGAIHTLSDQPRLCAVDDARCALILPGFDRQQAIELLRYVQNGLSDWISSKITLSFSAGLAALAFPPKNYAVKNLVDAAERCLYAAQASGGNSIKSIDVY